MNAAVDERGRESRPGAEQAPGAAGKAGHAGPPPGDAANGAARPDPLAGVQESFAALMLYAAHYFAALRDLAITRVRLAVFWGVVGMLVLFAAATAAIVAVTLVLCGIALGLADLLGGRLWAGALITGSVFLAGCGVAAVVSYRWMISQWHGQMAAKYEQYQERERAERHLQ